ncbi:MAG: histidine kinase dimerization/phospho-acceptor domain-containing protein, partial [Geminicoccaceae bacterium]|nr:histidine kinase dimerization/phospho-acceptor domain-containing protein [Geminicoccaceae bacterium]
MAVAGAIRPWRLSLSALQILAPATVVLVGLYLGGFLAAAPGLGAWLVAALLSGLLASLRERRLEVTRQYLTELVEVPDAPPAPPLAFGPLIDDGLDRSFRRLSTALREGRQRAAEADRLLSTLLDAMPDPVIVVEADRRVRRANRAAVREFGADLIERPLEASLRDPGLLGAVDSALQGEAGPTPEAEDDRITLQLSGTPPRAFAARVIRLPLGGVQAALISLRELTEQLMIERMRSDFIANASHEMRTPLAALQGFIETLQGPARDDPKARERFLQTMAAEARRMSRLVDDLLSLSRIELTAHQPPTGRVRLIDVVRTVLDNLEPYAAQHGVRLERQLPDELREIPGDLDQLIQLLTNLVDNGIKYGASGGVVTVAVDRDDASPPVAGPLTGRPAVRIVIRDRGP